jgi:hypothetical protein
MDEYVCACCADPVTVQTDFWMPLSDPYVSAGYEAAYVDPVDVEPAYVEPTYVEPTYVEPTYVEPAYVEPAYVEPAYAEPVYAEPIYQTEPIVLAAPEPISQAVAMTPTPEATPSIYEALASPTFGGDPWDSSHVLEMQRMSNWMLNNSIPASTGSLPLYHPEPIMNSSINAALAPLNLLTLQNMNSTMRATSINLMNSGW